MDRTGQRRSVDATIAKTVRLGNAGKRSPSTGMVGTFLGSVKPAGRPAGGRSLSKEPFAASRLSIDSFLGSERTCEGSSHLADGRTQRAWRAATRGTKSELVLSGEGCYQSAKAVGHSAIKPAQGP
jgi:hypothetical protein